MYRTEFDEMSLLKKTSLKFVPPSSIWCSSSNPDEEKYCRFETLCYRTNSNEYFLLFDSNSSIFYPPSLFITNHTIFFGRLSAVWDHNRFLIKYLATIPFERREDLRNGSQFYWIPGHTLIMSRFKPDNLLHLIHDDILPLQATIREQIGTNKIDILFFNDHWPLLIGHPFFKQLAKRVFSQNEFTSESVICFQNAYLGLSTSTVWYQYGFKRPQSPIPRKPEEYRYMQIQVNELREKLFSLMRLDRIDCPRRNIVLIAREENRRILNLNEFSRYISKKFSNNLDVILVSRDKIDNFIELKQLINRVMCAEKFVAMHGSEQILALFIKPPANNQIEVIELFPYGIEAERSTIYRTFAESILGYRYSAWTNPIRANTRFPNENVHGLSHLTEEQKNSIQKSIDEPLEPFLCCDHLGWLYRIYQDTIVDINIFNRFLDEMKMTTDQHHHSSSLSLLNHNHQFWNFGEVQNLRCQFISIKNDEDIDRIKIEWDPPWNLPFIIEQQQKHESQRQYHYEVIIQKENDTDLKQPVQHNVYHTSNTWFELNYNENSFHCFHVWIKIKLNRNKSENGIIKSHFNRRPLFCCQNDDGST